nr:hypothetical protein [uncultured Rhodopila sp.]
MIRRSRRIMVLSAALALGGCGTIPLASLPALSRIDIATTDPSVLRVAVRLPDAVKPRPGGVTMDAVTRESGAADRTATFLLIETRDPGDLAGLPLDVPPGVSTYAYRLSADDLARFDALRRSALQSHAEGRTVSLGFGIATKEFCRVAALPPGPLPATSYLMTSETGRYVILTEDSDLRSLAKVKRELESLEPC